MRTPLIVGNWKMNMTLAQSQDLVKGIHYGLPHPGQVDVVVTPPFTSLHKVSEILKDSYISVAGQNMHWQDTGAFTGEISGSFLKDAGADYVIIGHSERRQYFDETDDSVNKKVKAALLCNLIPIVCVGETLQERESGQVESVIRSQVLDGLEGLAPQEISELVIAYEPVWAIGTGKTASTDEAEEVHRFIRDLIEENWSVEAGNRVRVLYGGSVKASSATELLSSPNIDGALVGGASLKASDFIDIIKAAASANS